MEISSRISQTRSRNHTVFLLIIALASISSWNPPHFMAQGRQFPDSNLGGNENEELKMRGLIGSRPPRCDQRCRNCGHCEAIQVPIASAMKMVKQEIKAIAYSRGDDVSNYKPMCWKCKCGDLIFNP